MTKGLLKMNKKFEGYGFVPTSLLAPDIEFHVGPEEEEKDKERQIN